MLIQDQLPGDSISDEQLNFFKGIGVDYLTLNPVPFAASGDGDRRLTTFEEMREYLLEKRDMAERHGLRLYNIALTAIDDISLCGRFITAGGADLMGVIVNKVWPEKYTRVKAATTRGLKNLGIRSFGTVPYEEILASPTVGQVAEQLDSEILCGAAGLDNRVGKILIAAMEPDHMVPYLEDRALVITPGDRSGNVLAILATHMLSRGAESPVSGVILTGGFRPAQWVVDLLAGSRLPVILCSDDTYTVAAELHRKVFKITPDDKERIESAPTLVSQHVDTDGILESLGG